MLGSWEAKKSGFPRTRSGRVTVKKTTLGSGMIRGGGK